MRTRQTIYKDMFDEFGGVSRAAEAIGVAEKTARFWETPVDASGCEMPVNHLTKFLPLASRVNTLRMPFLVDEVIDHFAKPAGREILDRKIRDMVVGFLQQGRSAFDLVSKNPFLCATCHQPRQTEVDDGVTAVLRCRNPQCKAFREGR